MEHREAVYDNALDSIDNARLFPFLTAAKC